MTPADEAALRPELRERLRISGRTLDCHKADHEHGSFCLCRKCVMDLVEATFALGRASGWQAGAEAQREADIAIVAPRTIIYPEVALRDAPLVTDDQRASVSGERDVVEAALIEAKTVTNSLYSDLRDLQKRWTTPCIGKCSHGACPLLREIGAIIEARRTEIINAKSGERDGERCAFTMSDGEPCGEPRKIHPFNDSQDAHHFVASPTDRNAGRGATRETTMRDALACVIEFLDCCEDDPNSSGDCDVHGSRNQHYAHVRRAVEAALKGGGE